MTHQTRVQNAFDDVAGDMCQALYLGDAAEALRGALAAQCIAMVATGHAASASTSALKEPREARSLHFAPPGVGHAVTAVYPLPPGQLRASTAVGP